MMTQEQFDVRLAQIETQYGQSRHEADSFRDQELARLFVECGWTQVRIAARMGKTHRWVGNRLLLGRFLNWYGRTNSKSPADLCEWRFRDAWRLSRKGGHPKETEDERFARVAELLRTTPLVIPARYGNLGKSPGIKPAVVELMKDGLRRGTAEIVAELQDRFTDIDNRQVSQALRTMQQKPPKGFVVKARHSGKSHKYTLVKRHKEPALPITSIEDAASVCAESLPLIEESIEILKQPIVGRQTTLALQHLWRVKQMLSRLLVLEPVA